MSGSPPEISIILPAFREEAVIGEVVAKVRKVLDRLDRTSEIIVVDDGSNDGTGKEAMRAGARVVTHPYNIGNGASVKSGIRAAAGRILVMLDADGQHDPEDIPRLLDKINTYDMVVGARVADSDTSLHRDMANRIYNLLATYVCGRRIDDLTSGFRVMRAELARNILYLLPNTFSYPTTSTLATIRSGRSLAYVPIKTARRVGKSKIRLFKDGSRFFFIILKIATLFSPMKIFLPVSLGLFLAGSLYGIFRIIRYGSYSPMTVFFTVSAVTIFMIGLVSEQIAQSRYDRSELNALPEPEGIYDGTDLSSTEEGKE